MNENTRANVILPDGDIYPFNILAGVLQGETLAPYLFVTVLDYALWMAIECQEGELGFHYVKSMQIRLDIVTDLDFADDIAIGAFEESRNLKIIPLR